MRAWGGTARRRGARSGRGGRFDGELPWGALFALVLFASLAEAADPTPPAEVEASAPAPSEQWWNIHFTSTVAIQYHPAFSAAYSGQNSM
jgi:hypothetical protein